MPTFDQLPPEQRAIIELVIQRGRSYEDLADALAITADRVRELAVDALVELSPRTANRVEAQRRPQVADYVLNQQSSAEATATRSFLKRSEAGRMWILSLMDSLEHMYEDGSVPEIPEPGADEEERPRRRERERPSRERAGRERPSREREREPDRGERRPLRGDRERERTREREPLRAERDRDRVAEPSREPLSPEAQRAVRNRRIVAAVGALLLIVAITLGILAATGTFDSEVREAKAPEIKLVGELRLNPLERGSDIEGVALVAQRVDQRTLLVQARLKPSGRNQAYEVWLYNSDKDAVSLGAQVTDREGNYQGVGRLPAPLDRYKFIDVSLESVDRNPGHGGNSVLRGEIANLQPPRENPQGAGQQPGAPPAQPGAGGQPQPPAGGGAP